MKKTLQIIPVGKAPVRFSPKIDKKELRKLAKTNYAQPSDDRKNKIDFRGQQIYIADPLSSGNSKLSKNILIFDLLAVLTCPNCKMCGFDCYALKAQRQYPGCFNKRLINTHLAIHDLAKLEELITAQLEKTRKPFVRIHSSGDFFSQRYADMWARIAAKFPRIHFYTYTKSPFRPAPVANLNIVESILPDGLPNFGPLESIKARLSAIPGAVLCPYGVGEHSDPVHCGTTCTACMHCRFVGFKQH